MEVEHEPLFLEEPVFFSTSMMRKGTSLVNFQCPLCNKGSAVREQANLVGGQDYGQSYELYEPSQFRHSHGAPFCVGQPLRLWVWPCLTRTYIPYPDISNYIMSFSENFMRLNLFRLTFTCHIMTWSNHGMIIPSTWNFDNVGLFFDSPAASLRSLRTLELEGWSSRYIHMGVIEHLSSILLLIIIIECDHHDDNFKIIIITTSSNVSSSNNQLSLHLPYTRFPRQSSNVTKVKLTLNPWSSGYHKPSPWGCLLIRFDADVVTVQLFLCMKGATNWLSRIYSNIKYPIVMQVMRN